MTDELIAPASLLVGWVLAVWILAMTSGCGPTSHVDGHGGAGGAPVVTAGAGGQGGAPAPCIAVLDQCAEGAAPSSSCGVCAHGACYETAADATCYVDPANGMSCVEYRREDAVVMRRCR